MMDISLAAQAISDQVEARLRDLTPAERLGLIDATAQHLAAVALSGRVATPAQYALIGMAVRVEAEAQGVKPERGPRTAQPIADLWALIEQARGSAS